MGTSLWVHTVPWVQFLSVGNLMESSEKLSGPQASHAMMGQAKVAIAGAPFHKGGNEEHMAVSGSWRS